MKIEVALILKTIEEIKNKKIKLADSMVYFNGEEVSEHEKDIFRYGVWHTLDELRHIIRMEILS